MRPSYFYYQNVKNIIAAFGTIFSDVIYVNDFRTRDFGTITLLTKRKVYRVYSS